MTKLFRIDDEDHKIAGRPTWLTPFYDMWVETFGGRPNARKMAHDLKPLVDMHGAQKVLAHLKVYCERNNPQYVSTSRFAETFGAWSPTENRKKHEGPDDDAIAGKLRALGRVRLGWGPWALQQRMEEVGFDGLNELEQSRLVRAWRECQYR